MELFVGGSTVEELEVDGRVAAVEAGRLAEGVDEKVADGIEERIEQFVGGCIPVVPLIYSIISSQKNSLVIEMLTNYDITRKMVPITGRASASFSSMLKLKRIGNE